MFSPCFRCRGKDADCPRCRGTNRVDIVGCPHEQITEEVCTLFDAAELMKQGVLPVEGGWLDQTESFLAAIAAVRADQAWWKQERSNG